MIPWAWLNWYQKRRAIGLCAQDFCQEYTGEYRMCGEHRKQKAVSSKAWNAKDYIERKLAGRCVARGCPEPSCETAFKCSMHEALHASFSKRYRASRRGRERRRKIERMARNRRTEKGLCAWGTCPNELATSTLCEYHRQRKIADSERLREKRGDAVGSKKCTVCKTAGHNSQSCKSRAQHADDMPSIDHYATAQYGGWQQEV